MKKQLFLLLLLAIFAASSSTVFGQALPNSGPRPISCTPDSLHPVAGVPYDYTALLNPDGGNAYWFATTTENFITNSGLTANQEAIGGDYVSAATNYQTGGLGAVTPNTTTITWNGLGLSQVDYTAATPSPLFVVINYTADPADGCNNNLKVYRIEPMNAFQVNVLNLGGTYDIGVESCYDDVATAQYNYGSNCVTYDYGYDTLAYEIVAAYFTDSYTPTFRVDGLMPDQEATVIWSYTNDILTGTTLGTLTADGTIAGTAVSTTVPSTENGVSIYVWLVVHHFTYEGLTNDDITLAAAGVTEAGENNVRWDDCDIEVDITAALTATNGPDYGTHTLNARPDVQPGNPGAFEPPCPAAK